ncbi:MAG TPA: DUF4159 domain-containing protein [Pirellulales bacterium]|nr:DUF4159 domain-containing protein [Pirellulales bacterium]
MKSILSLALILAVSLGPWTSVAKAEISAGEVRDSIDRGVAYLKREQRDDGSWPDPVGYPGGITALCTLALLNCGVATDDEQLQAALNYLRKLPPPTRTYSTALQTMVFCAAEPKTNLQLVRRNALWFQKEQKREGAMKGAWGYPETEGDNSNTQFALLALHEAERIGVAVNDQTWRLAFDYWARAQQTNGSWGYKPGQAGTGSMTCAGIAAMVITADRLNRGDAEIDGNRVRCCGQQQDNEPVERALAWFGRNFSIDINPGDRGQGWLMYYLYGIERVGRLTNRRLIGQHDWYREGAAKLVRTQEPLSGFWKGVGHAEDNPHVATSLALLFLSKGRRPVLAAKLKHGPLDDWNHHRSDLANLTSYVETRWQRDLTWQVIDSAAASVADLQESPVLYISGQLHPDFSDDEVDRLRQYVNQGGFIFAEACCDGDDFDQGFRALTKRMFPEPEYALHLLPKEHPAYSAEERVDVKFIDPELYGIDVGCRTSVIYAPRNLRLSCLWELARPGRDQKLSDLVAGQIEAARAVGINVLAYATNREVKYKLDIERGVEPDETRDLFERAKIYITQIKHNGGWNAAPGALVNLLRVISRETGLRVSTDQRELALDNPKLFGYQIVFLHGRQAFRLGDAERKQLRMYIERGGVVIGDAICGSEEFAKSFRAEMAAALPGHPLEAIPANHRMFTTALGGFDLKKVGRREPQPQGEGGPLKTVVREVEPELEGVRFDDRYGVIFSRYDLSCALEKHDSLECLGYTREDAAKIGLNVVLYALQQ